MSRRALSLFLGSLLLLQCAENVTPVGIAPTIETGGPVVVFDLEARPLPEIPFPNDLATRYDPTSPTGQRINISQIAPTLLEGEVREQANRLDGFGTYTPITVSFDSELDLESFVQRHHDNNDISDDLVYVINIDPESSRFGEAVPLDIGQGNFPYLLRKPDQYFDYDTRAETSSLMFDTTEEDLNGNGRLDEGEDTDFDGVLDHPNTFGGDDPYTDLLTFYERETNTLIVRPLIPMAQHATHAVVITREVTDRQGRAVQSPFPFVNHTRQTDALQPLLEVIDAHPEHGLTVNRIAFAWTFTTASVTADLEAIRRGIYGHGTLGWLADEYPTTITSVDRWLGDVREEENVYVLPRQSLQDLIRVLLPAAFEGDASGTDALIQSYEAVEYFVGGEFTSPYFLIDRDGLASEGNPQDDDEIFEIDRAAGTAVVGPQTVPFWCSVPAEVPGRYEAPFPVVLYGHGYGLTRFEMLIFAGNLARHGLAICAIDAVGHGLVLEGLLGGGQMGDLVDSLIESYNLTPGFARMQAGRARDLTNDGIADSGFDFFTADVFHTRDMVRQTIVDDMQFIRVLRTFDGQTRWPFDIDGDGENELAGDWNHDGTVDLGGWDQDYMAFGGSLGGIRMSVLAGIEPMIVAAVPEAGGAGMADIGIRSTQAGVPEAAILNLMGPILLGDRNSESGLTRLRWLVPNGAERGYVEIGETDLIGPGDRVVLRNATRLARGVPGDETRFAIVAETGEFRIQTAADAMSATERRARYQISVDSPLVLSGDESLDLGDAMLIEVYRGDERTATIDHWLARGTFQGTVYEPGARLVAPAMGWGLRRASPEFRRFLGVAQMIFDPGDPVGYAPHYVTDPIDYSDIEPDDVPGTNVLLIVTIGDSAVPVNTGIALARSAGFIELVAENPAWGKTENDVLLDNFVIEGIARLERFGSEIGAVLFDVDDLDDTTDGKSPPELNLDPPLRITIETPSGVSGLRMPYLAATGGHVFTIPEPNADFDIATFMIHQVGVYLESRGTEIRDDHCLEDFSCADFEWQ
jgi:hypothetical protein